MHREENVDEQWLDSKIFDSIRRMETSWNFYKNRKKWEYPKNCPVNCVQNFHEIIATRWIPHNTNENRRSGLKEWWMNQG